MSNSSVYSDRFERFLRSYQKISLFLLFPALISAFSCVVALFNPSYNLGLSMAVVLGIKPLLTDNANLILMFISLGVLAVSVPLALFAAKGKIWCFFVDAGIYFADLVYCFFLIGRIEMTPLILQFAVHGVFLAAYVAGIVFYFKADQILKAHPDILSK